MSFDFKTFVYCRKTEIDDQVDKCGCDVFHFASKSAASKSVKTICNDITLYFIFYSSLNCDENRVANFRDLGTLLNTFTPLTFTILLHLRPVFFSYLLYVNITTLSRIFYVIHMISVDVWCVKI